MSRSLLIFLPFALLCVSCATEFRVQNRVSLKPSRSLDPPAQTIVVANTYDVSKRSYRESKEGQFKLLIDGAMQSFATAVEEHTYVTVRIHRDRQPICKSCLEDLMSAYGANYAVVLDSFAVYFDQTEVVVTKTEDGKSREAFYDIVSEIEFRIVGREGLREDFPTVYRRFHSSRSVMSGLLAAGPNIVSNHDDAIQAVTANVHQFLRNYFPDTEDRVRPMLVSKDFKGLDELVRSGKIDEARTLCESQTSKSKRLVVAQAYYNLAVLAEHTGDLESVSGLLGKSLGAYVLPQAQAMRTDY